LRNKSQAYFYPCYNQIVSKISPLLCPISFPQIGSQPRDQERVHSQHTLSHIQHTKSILSSPPKKRPYTSSTTGTTQVHQQTVQNHPSLANQSPSQPNPNYAAATLRRFSSAHYTQQTSTELRTPRIIPTPNNDNDFKEAINNRFLLVEEELKEQKRWNNERREWNEDMLLRMNYIEDTTTSTDCKVDTILSRLDSWDIPTK
jgi:hypothetical protein